MRHLALVSLIQLIFTHTGRQDGVPACTTGQWGVLRQSLARERACAEWAVTAEVGCSTRFQATQDSWSDFSDYFTRPDGRVVYLDLGFNSFTWRDLP